MSKHRDRRCRKLNLRGGYLFMLAANKLQTLGAYPPIRHRPSRLSVDTLRRISELENTMKPYEPP